VFCGACGRSMQVRYQDRHPRYECSHSRADHVDEARRMSPELLGEIPHLSGSSLSVWFGGYRMLCGVSGRAAAAVARRVTTATGSPQ
jgi:hypothetical protein